MVDKFFLIKENWRKIEEELNKKSETTINKLLRIFQKREKLGIISKTTVLLIRNGRWPIIL